MAHTNEFPRYQSQLLRMWAEQPPRRLPVWRFSLEDVGTGQRCGFADLEALITHLLALMEEQPAPGRCTSEQEDDQDQIGSLAPDKLTPEKLSGATRIIFSQSKGINQ